MFLIFSLKKSDGVTFKKSQILKKADMGTERWPVSILLMYDSFWPSERLISRAEILRSLRKRRSLSAKKLSSISIV